MPPSESSSCTRAEALVALRAVMQAEFGLPPDRIQPSTHLVDDLDLDSIDFVDIAVSLEESIGLRLVEEELKAVRTVQDLLDAIHAGLLRGRAGSA